MCGVLARHWYALAVVVSVIKKIIRAVLSLHVWTLVTIVYGAFVGSPWWMMIAIGAATLFVINLTAVLAVRRADGAARAKWCELAACALVDGVGQAAGAFWLGLLGRWLLG